MAFLADLQSFDKGALHKAETVVRPMPVICAGTEEWGTKCLGGMVESEKRETPEETKQHAQAFAKMLKAAKHAVIFTGAGVSTSTGVADYRGPNGVWTCLATGRIPDESVDLHTVKPSYTHMCITKLVEKKMVKFVTSTNLDGLHWKSGLEPHINLSELHGNMYCARCPRCKAEYYGNDPVKRTPTRFLEGKWCSCGGNLMDSGIDFGQTLPLQHLSSSEKHGRKADLSLVVGTSMRVSPASKIPIMNDKGKLCIVNLMDTPFDTKAKLRAYCSCDDFFFHLMDELKLSPDFPPQSMPAPFDTYRE